MNTTMATAMAKEANVCGVSKRDLIPSGSPDGSPLGATGAVIADGELSDTEHHPLFIRAALRISGNCPDYAQLQSEIEDVQVVE